MQLIALSIDSVEFKLERFHWQYSSPVCGNEGKWRGLAWLSQKKQLNPL